jgi:HEPN domain-containing protein
MITSEEWLRQADYDYDTAEYMFNGGRYFYSVFMAHLALEKSLKAVYTKKFGEIPPKVHNLIYFLEKTDLQPPEEISKFLINLNNANVVTRYPEELSSIQNMFPKEIVQNILLTTRKTILWIKQMQSV